MEEKKRGPGRPQTLLTNERRARILEAAGSLFTQQGYGETNMAQIAQYCGMSKRTLYTLFESKDALFAALICDVGFVQHDPHVGRQGQSPTEALFDALMHTAEWVLSPRQIGLMRLIISESSISPDLAAKFRLQVFDIGRQQICEYLNIIYNPTNKNKIHVLASILYGATIADLQLRALAGEDIEIALAKESISVRIQNVIKMMANIGT